MGKTEVEFDTEDKVLFTDFVKSCNRHSTSRIIAHYTISRLPNLFPVMKLKNQLCQKGPKSCIMYHNYKKIQNTIKFIKISKMHLKKGIH